MPRRAGRSRSTGWWVSWPDMAAHHSGFRCKQAVVVALSPLAAIAWLGLAVSVSHASLAFIPAKAPLFVVGRAAF